MTGAEYPQPVRDEWLQLPLGVDEAVTQHEQLGDRMPCVQRLGVVSAEHALPGSDDRGVPLPGLIRSPALPDGPGEAAPGVQRVRMLVAERGDPREQYRLQLRFRGLPV